MSVAVRFIRTVRDMAISDKAVTVDVTTTAEVSVLLGNVEPFVRLKTTFPASMVKGDELP